MKANQKHAEQFARDQSGVSPIVATLMLVLVAAGAAVGFNVWMKGFQEDSTANVGKPKDVQVLTIGGSSTVYEFSLAALQGCPVGTCTVAYAPFGETARAAGTPIEVQLEKGGSGAGRQAVGTCKVDIGASSSPVKTEELAKWPDCSPSDGVKDFGQELNVFKVATDGVVFATLSTNTHCATDIQLTKGQAYSIYYHNMGNSGGTLKAGAPAPGAEDLDAAANGGNADGDVQWSEVPREGGSKCAGSELVEIFDRKDPGGTSEIATQKLFGGSQSQLEDFIGTLGSANQGDGNQGVLDQVNKHANKNHALWFTSFGYATAKSLLIADFGTTTADILDPSSANIKDETYDATRPILYITAGTPSALEQIWLDFVMNPHNNQGIAEKADFISIY